MSRPSPAAILDGLNEAVLAQSVDDRFCTVAVVHLVPSAGVPGAFTATTSLGGHPTPLVVRADGSIATHGEEGTLIGAVVDPILSDRSTELGPGDTLVLYTDGLLDAGAPTRLIGFEQLVVRLAGAPGRTAQEIVDDLERAAKEASGGRPRDDIAILALRVSGESRAAASAW